MATAARRQDMPPAGGYKPLNYSRLPAKSLIGGKGLIFGHFAITAGALYLYSLNYKNIRRDKIELRSSMLAITPLLQAERDRAFLKQIIKNREEEASLMSGVEGWEVGTYYGEPLYKTIPADTFIQPELHEYFVHTSEKDVNNYYTLKMWQ